MNIRHVISRQKELWTDAGADLPVVKVSERKVLSYQIQRNKDMVQNVARKGKDPKAKTAACQPSYLKPHILIMQSLPGKTLSGKGQIGLNVGDSDSFQAESFLRL